MGVQNRVGGEGIRKVLFHDGFPNKALCRTALSANYFHYYLLSLHNRARLTEDEAAFSLLLLGMSTTLGDHS